MNFTIELQIRRIAMALPLPLGKQIQVYRRVLSGEFKMNSMEAATDHYSIGLIIHGDRTIITPQMTYTAHSGAIQTLAPFLYHKTIPASNEYYESILIKFSEDFAKPFTDQLGHHILDQIYQVPLKNFSDKEVQNKIFDLAWDMLTESDSTSPENIKNFKLQNLLFQILVSIYEHGLSDNNKNIYQAPLSAEIMDAIYYIESNYMNSLRIEKAAKIAGYSVSYFSRLFQNQLGITFSDYCTDVRLKHAQHALLTTNKSVTDISLETGFVYPGNMTNCFKKKLGITPLQFRKQSTIQPHSQH